MKNTQVKFITIGILFSMLWSSASVAAKFGILSVEPLVLFQFRFMLAGILMLFYAYFIEKSRLPTRSEWIALAIFGFLNVTVYLSLFVLGIREVAAGIGSLSTSLGPLMMSLLAGVFLGAHINKKEILALFLGVTGVAVAVYPLLFNSYASIPGLVYLGFSMLSYSLAALYYSQREWHLSRMAINGWQVFLGGIFMFPLTLLFHEKSNVFDARFWFSMIWLAVPVSGLAVSLWLWLLKKDPVRASFFLFLCPIFGFIFATFLLGEPFTIYTLAGLVFVLAGLYFGQKKN
ncbi:DMT family transporter [Emticicia sp. CRIBPO]|uniref:DMT family transporter n=1 Tax=Emticicia sp. CRIBPO TaxID=2683258 RepID=UPI001E41DEE8|nr:DMT family transporter [Emticicia sp. CRIBPO]